MKFNDKLKIYYDAEFTGLHRNTSLISIGLVSDTGSYFYAEFTDYDEKQVNDWIRENVIDNLLYNNESNFVKRVNVKQSIHINDKVSYNVRIKGGTDIIKSELLDWLKNESEVSEKQIQIYTDCYAYDWVLLNELICENGDALNIPEFINYIPIDLSTLLFISGIDPDITRENFVSEKYLNDLKTTKIFQEVESDIKHNCLWDALVARGCFHKLFHPHNNGRKYDWSELNRDIDSDKVNDLIGNHEFVGEINNSSN